MSAPILELRGVRKAYGGRTVLDGADLHLGPGTIAALVGPSGCGKSTLLRCLSGFEPIDGGTIRIAGHEITARLGERAQDRLRSDVGVLFQDFPLFPHLSVLDNVTLAPRIVRRRARADAEAAGREWLAKVGLADRDACRTNELSGGQRQRVALARALALGVQVLLLDEPTSALDPGTRDEMRTMLSELVRRSDDGLTLLVVTHDVPFARDLADEIWQLDAGRLQRAG